MKTDQLLAAVTKAAGSRAITRDDLLAAYDRGAGAPRGDDRTAEGYSLLGQHLSLSTILYFIGGVVVLLGIIILIVQNWEDFGTLTRILVTLGSAVAAHVAGALFQTRRDFRKIGHVFFLVSCVLLPIGILVTLTEYDVDLEQSGTQSLVALLLTLVYLASFAAFRSLFFLPFAIAAATWLYFSSTDYLAGDVAPAYPFEKFTEYRVLFLGASYIALGFFFQTVRMRSFGEFLSTLGLIAVLVTSLVLGGWTPYQSLFWEFFFPVLALGAVFGSIPLRQRYFLAIGSLGFMAYIVKITSEYFADSLGWPFALVIAGFGLIATGYVSLLLRKKYVATPSPLLS